MMKNKRSPLEQLRQEKEILRQECADGEARLSEHWTYISHNAGSLAFNSIVNTVARKLGFGGFKDDSQDQETTASTGFAQSAFNGLLAYYPLIWEFVQPMLIRFAIRKFKSLFTRKKKKKKDDED